MAIISRNNRIIKTNSNSSFKITITVTAGGTFTLPLRSGFTYKFIVDWGDNTSSAIYAYNDPNITHTYANSGDYQLEMSGILQSWYFNNSGDKLKLKTIDNWGNTGFTNLANAFYGCSNLISIPDSPLTGNISSLGFINTFVNTAIGSIPTKFLINQPNITRFNSTFSGCLNITQIPNDLFKYCTGTTNLTGTFLNCTSLTAIPTDLYRYNTAITSMSTTFQGCLALTSIPEDLFYYNNLITDYSSCFIYSLNVVLPTRLFNLSNLSIVTNFNNFIGQSTTSNNVTGTIQDIWNYTTATSVAAFRNTINIANYASIPAAWK